MSADAPMGEESESLGAHGASTAVEDALHEAIAAIYFDDGSDFKRALLRIVRILGGAECLDQLNDDPSSCYQQSVAGAFRGRK